MEFVLPEMKFRWKLWKRGLEFAEEDDAVASRANKALFETLGIVPNWQPDGFISAAKAIKWIKLFSFLTAIASAVLIALRIDAGCVVFERSTTAPDCAFSPHFKP